MAERRILIVEDDETLIAGLQAILSRAGYQTRAALSGPAALQIMETFTPDLIVTDVQMPDMSGLELIEKVRADSEGSDLPFVVISARTSRSDENRIAAMTNVSYLRKPFEIEALLAVLGEYLDAPPPD